MCVWRVACDCCSRRCFDDVFCCAPHGHRCEARSGLACVFICTEARDLPLRLSRRACSSHWSEALRARA